MGCANSTPKVKEPWLDHPAPIPPPTQPTPDVALRQVVDCPTVDETSESEHEEAAPPPPPPPSFFNTNLAWANSVWTAPAMNVVEEDPDTPPVAVSHSRTTSDASSVGIAGPNPFSQNKQDPVDPEDPEESYLSTHVNFSNMVWKHAIKQPDAYAPVSKPDAPAKGKAGSKAGSGAKSDIAQSRDVQKQAKDQRNATAPKPTPATNQTSTAGVAGSRASAGAGPKATGQPARNTTQSSAFSVAKAAAAGGQNAKTAIKAEANAASKPAAPSNASATTVGVSASSPAGVPMNQVKTQQAAGRGGLSMKEIKAQQDAAKAQKKPAGTAAAVSVHAVQATPGVQPNFAGNGMQQTRQQQAMGQGGLSMKDLKAQQDAAARARQMQHMQQQQPMGHFYGNNVPVSVGHF